MISTFNKNIGLTVLICLTSCILIAQNQPDRKQDNKTLSTEKELIRLSELFFTALKNHDSTTADGFLSKEFLLTSSESNGTLTGKKQYMSVINRPDILQVSEFRMHDFVIRIYNNIAIVQSRLFWRSVYRNKPWNTDFLNTDIWYYENEKWTIVSRHTSYPAQDLKRIVEERQS